MKQSFVRFVAVGLLGFVTITGTACGAPEKPAAGSEKSKDSAEKVEKKEAAETTKSSSQPLPFHGKISSVDPKLRTITLAGKEKSRVFYATSTTKFTLGDGKSATFEHAKAGEEVGGSYEKKEKDRLELKSLRIGPKAEKK